MLSRLFYWVVLLAACSGVVWATSYGFSPASSTAEWQLVDVPPTMSIADLADRLQDTGIIRSKVCFLAAARLSGESGELQPGQYRLSPDMTPVAIVEKIARGDIATDWVVVPEGYTVQQIERLLQKHGLAHPQKWDQAVRQVLRNNEGDIHSTSLEGYLFPDTYLIPKTMSEVSILQMMVDRFRQQVNEKLKSDIQHSRSGLSLRDTIILASLVEKEAQHDDERAHIAGVLLNRLRNGTRLECDATIEYVLAVRKSHLNYGDTSIDSPYNTYKHRGLPPTPICCPGLASIRAALNPATTRDLYYVAMPGGYHVFSQTLAEHDRAKHRAREMRDTQT